MAKRQYRPGRTLVIFFVGLAFVFGLVGISDSNWKPTLGLDLQGGTRIQLTADGNPTSDSLSEARNITDQRVNGSGVAEAAVTVQGSDSIVVEIPGAQAGELEEVVKRQAQLRFRLVACSPFTTCGTPAFDPNDPTAGLEELPSTPELPGAGVTAPPAAEPDPESTPEPDPSETSGNNRPPVSYAAQGEKKNDKKNANNSAAETPTESPTDGATDAPTDAPTDGATDAPADGSGDGAAAEDTPGTVESELAFQATPDQASIDLYNSLQCSPEGNLQNADGSPALQVDDPNKPLVACSQPEEAVTSSSVDRAAEKYLLTKALIEGTELDDASAGIPQGELTWVVTLEIGGEGRSVFGDISRALQPTEDQFAIVLDGQVISAPTMEGVITNGQAQISGNFNETTANQLATSLKFGSLPISFNDDATTVTEIGPSLAGNQLNAGLLAGLVGLLLVMFYCLIYYRGLGVVVILSLLVAAGATYGMVLLLSEAANFTLTLPGIAGLIVAVGITADSFIVFFERIRDEMRDGKSMRVAVESGWARARNTCVAADTVSLLAAVVLYIFAAGVVKGFAFALGLTTLIDLVVFFFFTKPMVSYLARYKFFNQGHKMSGLNSEALGVERVPDRQKSATAGVVGGRA
ncbi:protein translocase subunit SecD [Nocardioides salsibiostraticola]